MPFVEIAGLLESDKGKISLQGRGHRKKYREGSSGMAIAVARDLTS